MQVVDRVAQLFGPFDHQRHHDGILAFNKRPKVVAGHVIHHQVLAVILDEIIDHSRQVGVLKRGQQACLADELCRGVRAEVVVGFHRHLVGQALVFRQVHLAHAAFPQGLNDLIS